MQYSYVAILICCAMMYFDLTKPEASVVMQRLSYPTETVLTNKVTRTRIVLSFNECPRKP